MMGLLSFQKTAPGILQQGNIDLSKRPMVRNPDGSTSTVRSISIGTPDGEVLIPTISPDGKSWTEDQAIENFYSSGQHLGVFSTPQDATAYAKKLHDQQAQSYGLLSLPR